MPDALVRGSGHCGLTATMRARGTSLAEQPGMTRPVRISAAFSVVALVASLGSAGCGDHAGSEPSDTGAGDGRDASPPPDAMDAEPHEDAARMADGASPDHAAPGDAGHPSDAGHPADATTPPSPAMVALVSPEPGEWPTYKRDIQHRGLAADMTGDIAPGRACVRWSAAVTGVATRGGGGPVVGVIDGVPTVLVAVDGSCGVGCNNEAPGSVVALRGTDGAVLWSTALPNGSRADPYAPLLADIDADGRRELVVPASFLRDANHVYAFTTEDEGAGAGALQWSFDYTEGDSSEAGPIAADLDGDGVLEVAIGSDTGRSGRRATFYVIDGATGRERASIELPGRADRDPRCEDLNKMDSASPAAARVGDRTLFFTGGWGGSFYALGLDRAGELEIAWEYLIPEDRELPCSIGKDRSAPLIGDIDGDGRDEVVFGTMYEEDAPGGGYDPDIAIFRAATLRALDAATGELVYQRAALGSWKSSPSLGDVDGESAGLEIVGGRVGGVYAVSVPSRPAPGATAELPIDWDVDLSGGTAGNRSSPAIADLDRDGALEVVIQVEAAADDAPAGLFVLRGLDGEVLWSIDAPRLRPGQGYRGGSGSPALADIDADGALEIVYLAADGVVYAIDGACDAH